MHHSRAWREAPQSKNGMRPSEGDAASAGRRVVLNRPDDPCRSLKAAEPSNVRQANQIVKEIGRLLRSRLPDTRNRMRTAWRAADPWRERVHAVEAGQDMRPETDGTRA